MVTAAAKNPRDALKSGITKSGAKGTVICNLPHGLDVAIRNEAGEEVQRVVFNGRNHRRALNTNDNPEIFNDGVWGITPDVSKEFWDAFVKQGHPAISNSCIQFFETFEKAQDAAEAMGNAVETGTAPLNPDAPGDGVEPADKD